MLNIAGYIKTKKETLAGLSVKYVKYGSHEVLNNSTLIVAVAVGSDATKTLSGAFSVGVGDKTVAGLEANFRLEGAVVDGAYHLEGYIGAVEETSVIGAGALVTDNIVLVSSTVGREGIDIDSVLTVDSTSEGITSVVNLEVGVQGRGVIEYTSHGQSRGDISRSHDDVALPSTSSLGDAVCISLDVEQETLELLNAPATVGVNIQVEETSVGNIDL